METKSTSIRVIVETTFHDGRTLSYETGVSIKTLLKVEKVMERAARDFKSYTLKDAKTGEIIATTI